MQSLYTRLAFATCIALTVWNLSNSILSTGKSLLIKTGCFIINLTPEGAIEKKLVLPIFSFLRVELASLSEDKLNWHISFPSSRDPLIFKNKGVYRKYNSKKADMEIITFFEFECARLGTAEIQWYYQSVKKKDPVSVLCIEIIPNS